MALLTPFAQNGDKKEIPQNTSDGSVSFDRGFGSFYALPPEEGGLFIDRAQFNQLMYDTTSAVIDNKQEITTLKSQMNGLIGGGNTPKILQNKIINIKAGIGGDFTSLTEALQYAKQIESKNINAITSITLLSDFNDDLTLDSMPSLYINCNNFKFGNKLTIHRSQILFSKLKLSSNLNTQLSSIHIFNGANIGSSSSETAGFGSCVVANSSNIVLSGNITLTSQSSQYGIFSKGNSNIYIVSGPSSFTQTTGDYFAYVQSGGIIRCDGSINLTGVTVTKTNIAANTLTRSGIIFGNIWG